LSINLGLVNLFPIPLLDGGHLLYYGVEALRGKPLADKVQQIGFKIGVALIGTFFIFALFNDVRKLNLF
jgi:regulator of sigma E protease